MKRLLKILSVLAISVILLLSAYIMLNGMGLVESLDFGAGAYYYADIPDFDKYMHEDAYTPQLPLWVYILLFLSWGYLMWRLIVRIEKS